jgi:hypothetical protein
MKLINKVHGKWCISILYCRSWLRAATIVVLPFFWSTGLIAVSILLTVGSQFDLIPIAHLRVRTGTSLFRLSWHWSNRNAPALQKAATGNSSEKPIGAPDTSDNPCIVDSTSLWQKQQYPEPAMVVQYSNKHRRVKTRLFKNRNFYGWYNKFKICCGP